MKKIKKITVTMSEHQAQLIVDALDLFMRLPMGQIEEIEFFFRRYMNDRLVKDNLDMIKPLLEKIKRILFRELSPGAYHGMPSDEVPEFAKEAFDLMQSIRNPMCRVRTPKKEWEMFCACDAVDQVSTIPLPVVKVEVIDGAPDES